MAQEQREARREILEGFAQLRRSSPSSQCDLDSLTPQTVELRKSSQIPTVSELEPSKSSACNASSLSFHPNSARLKPKVNLTMGAHIESESKVKPVGDAILLSESPNTSPLAVFDPIVCAWGQLQMQSEQLAAKSSQFNSARRDPRSGPETPVLAINGISKADGLDMGFCRQAEEASETLASFPCSMNTQMTLHSSMAAPPQGRKKLYFTSLKAKLLPGPGSPHTVTYSNRRRLLGIRPASPTPRRISKVGIWRPAIKLRSSDIGDEAASKSRASLITSDVEVSLKDPAKDPVSNYRNSTVTDQYFCFQVSHPGQSAVDVDRYPELKPLIRSVSKSPGLSCCTNCQAENHPILS